MSNATTIDQVLEMLKQPVLLVPFVAASLLACSQMLAGDFSSALITCAAGSTVVTLLRALRGDFGMKAR